MVRHIHATGEAARPSAAIHSTSFARQVDGASEEERIRRRPNRIGRVFVKPGSRNLASIRQQTSFQVDRQGESPVECFATARRLKHRQVAVYSRWIAPQAAMLPLICVACCGIECIQHHNTTCGPGTELQRVSRRASFVVSNREADQRRQGQQVVIVGGCGGVRTCD